MNLLTAREKEVLLHLGTGAGNRELAGKLGIAERTVKAHIQRIVMKLDQSTRLEAAVLSVLAHNLLCADPECRPCNTPGAQHQRAGVALS
ncbi:response regulator transcription factor [Streptomyces sp. MMG1121]|uniref:response regulator transcription factor n=1 Tax=Streptomyces sp. MMG1121 TaxID=1415544 RepID=UPI001F2BA673|nr:helix-turn-helix transcriptional regulator [Streptomyces sp. MMG1121]